jgi:hypothetical protein
MKEISYSRAITISKNYNSDKIQIGVVLECEYPEMGYEFAKDFVDKKLKKAFERKKKEMEP